MFFPLYLTSRISGKKTFSIAGFADCSNVCHKLHRYFNNPFALTFWTSSPLNIKGEMRMAVAVHLGVWLIGKEISYVIINLKISDRIGPCAFTNRILINIFY